MKYNIGSMPSCRFYAGWLFNSANHLKNAGTFSAEWIVLSSILNATVPISAKSMIVPISECSMTFLLISLIIVLFSSCCFFYDKNDLGKIVTFGPKDESSKHNWCIFCFSSVYEVSKLPYFHAARLLFSRIIQNYHR